MLQLAAATVISMQGAGIRDQNRIDVAQTAPSSSVDYGGPILERPTLTGDWGGMRNELSSHGLDLHVDLTQFYQGVTRGGLEGGLESGGKLDYWLNLDGQKAGLWTGFAVTTHAETRYGNDTNANDGLFTFSNFNMAFPKAGEDVTAVTSFKLTQTVSDEFSLIAGKINSLDDFTLNFTGRNGLDRFMNSAATANIISARTVPYSTYGAGFVLTSAKEQSLMFLVRDPDNHSASSDLDQLFANGALFTGVARLPVAPMGLPGNQVFGVNWSTRDYTSVDPASSFDVPGQGLVAGTESGSWALWYNCDQYLWVSDTDDDRGWGVFGMSGISDGNPNPVRWNATLGIGVNGLFAARRHDTLGAAYFHVGLSSDFKSLLAQPTAPPGLEQRDEQGVELFYNAELTPWCHLSSDLQFVQPSTKDLNNTVVFGMRLKFDF